MMAARGAQPVRLAQSVDLPLGHLSFSVSRSECGQRMWAIRFEPRASDGLPPVPMANGFLDTPQERAETISQLRAIADAMEVI